MKVTITNEAEVHLTKSQLAAAILEYVQNSLALGEEFDDAGCDWITDNRGNIYIGNSPEWVIGSERYELAALVDAANIINYGIPLKLADERESQASALMNRD